MSVSLVETQGNLMIGRCSGRLGYREWDQAQRVLADEIRVRGRLRLLIRLDDFHGWEKGEQWGDIGFFKAHDQDILAIAIVGEPRWRDEALMFSFAGMHQAPVAYFTDEHEAHAWLATHS